MNLGMSSTTALTASERDHLYRVSHFQVNFKFRKYWSGNTVFENHIPTNQLRFCPDCRDVIEHDERGHPYCLTCGAIFPLPRKDRPSTALKADRHRIAINRKFIRSVSYHEPNDQAKEPPSQSKKAHRIRLKHALSI